MSACVYILIKFELIDFNLYTACNDDLSVSIIGLNLNGKELFKFKIDKDTMGE